MKKAYYLQNEDTFYFSRNEAIAALTEQKESMRSREDMYTIVEETEDCFVYKYRDNSPSSFKIMETDAEAPRLWAVYHLYDEDGGFGDAIAIKDFIGIVQASILEREEFLAKWNKPEVYARPYAELEHHSVAMEEVTIENIADIEPY